uniref:NADH dehydrogenase subunit 6 n=1 Tax=Rosacea flaccida TaxID=316189 RepID=UPI0026E477CB|nr:NADH dehydrogenase subunit 6 [Rosacea flaccida]WJJ70104.1 NADH dehydrogenase subunit 6 [Rosacea flaccida]
MNNNYINLFFLITFFSFSLFLTRKYIYSIFVLALNIFIVSYFILKMKNEYLTFIILMIYLGAICIIFLFVLMLINLNEEKINKQSFSNNHLLKNRLIYFLISSFIIFILFFLKIIFLSESKNEFIWAFSLDKQNSVLFSISYLLYSQYFQFVFFLVITLLISMIGVGVLTPKEFENILFKEKSYYNNKKLLVKLK